MKKSLFVAVAGMLLFSACSNEEPVKGGNPEDDFNGQELVMKVVNTGDGLTSRAGRPLLSSEAGQSIDKVKLAIFKINAESKAIEKCVFVKEFADWTNDSQVYGPANDGKNDHGRYASLNLKKEIDGVEKGLDEGSYMVYAVGYSSSKENDQSVYTYEPGLENIVANWDAATSFTSVKATTKTDAEEIFAGSIAEIKVDAKRNFVVADAGRPDNNILYLHRQVAGAFGYFMNIPAAGFDGTAATNLRLVAADKNMTLNMTKFNTDFRNTGVGVKYVVNGEAGATPAVVDAKFKNGANGYVVYDITITDWFANGDSNKDGVFGNGDDWAIPAGLNGKYNAINGSLFAGKFVIPFANKNATTFELQLVNGNGVDAKILRTWTINLKAAQTGVVGLENDTELQNETASSYSIVRNHLYTIGRKDVANPTEPTGPTEQENPEDLSKGQILTLRVNDNWEVINQLEVEPEI